MSKRVIKFFTLLITITTLLSAAFVIGDAIILGYFGEEAIISGVFEKVRMFFDLVADFSVFGVILFCFSRYKLETALKSFYFALISFGFAFIFQIASETILFATVEEPNYELMSLYVTGLFNNCVCSITIFKIIPAILIAILTYKLTKDYSPLPKKFISFKNPITKAMGIFSLVMFGIGFSSLLIEDVNVVLSSVEQMTQKQFMDSFGDFVLRAIPVYLLYVLYFLVLLYCVLFLVYHISQKVSTTINEKKTNSSEEI